MGGRYYGWSFEKGIFRYFEHPGHLAPEDALEGKYVIQTGFERGSGSGSLQGLK
jgi:hypothetical protein